MIEFKSHYLLSAMQHGICFWVYNRLKFIVINGLPLKLLLSLRQLNQLKPTNSTNSNGNNYESLLRQSHD